MNTRGRLGRSQATVYGAAKRLVCPTGMFLLRSAIVSVFLGTLHLAMAGQVTPGGFGNGDSRTIPAFRAALSRNPELYRLQVPKAGGGMEAVIEALVATDTRVRGELLPASFANGLRRRLLLALEQPSRTPSRLYSLETNAFAFVGNAPQVVILICELCGTVTLAMRSGNEDNISLSPQLNLKDLHLENR